MFGVTAFAQEPFTSLSGPFYVTSDNGIVLFDEETVLAQFNPACLDSLAVTDTQAALGVYLGASLESQIVYDTTTSRADFIGAQDELVGLSTSEEVLAAFIASLADAMTLAMALSSITHYHPTCTDLIILSDYQYGRGWFKIDDNQAITWVAVVDAQASGWSLVDDTQDPNWVNVNDIQ